MGRIREEIATAVERGEAPDCLGLWVFWEAGDEVLGSLAHDLRERPVLLLGDHFEPLIERVGELDLSSCHDVFYTSLRRCRQTVGEGSDQHVSHGALRDLGAGNRQENGGKRIGF